MPGYKPFPLQDGVIIAQRLRCNHCQLVMKDPVQTKESGHIVCKECFYEILKSNKYLHPGDRVFYNDYSVKKEISMLRVLCLYHESGCEWNGLFKEYFEHISMCDHKNDSDKKESHTMHIQEPTVIIQTISEVIAEEASGSDLDLDLEAELVMPMDKSHDNLLDDGKLCNLGAMIFAFDQMSREFKAMIYKFDKISDEFKEMSEDLTKKIELIEKQSSDLEKKVEELQHLGEQTIAVKAKSKDKDSLEAQSFSPHISTQSVSACDEELITVEQSLLHTGSINSIDYQNHTTTSAADVKANEDQLAEMKREIQFLREQFNSSDTKAYVELIRQHEEVFAAFKVRFSELDEKVLLLTNPTNVWPISDVKEKASQARSGQCISIRSPPFCTGRNGYKMCITACLNGTGSGEGTHLSIFFVLMKGEYDPLLQWPFDHKISLILVDQDYEKDLVQTFRADPQSSSFQRPKTDMNVASGCPEFADLSILDNTSYVKDDVMYIKAIVDTSSICYP